MIRSGLNDPVGPVIKFGGNHQPRFCGGSTLSNRFFASARQAEITSFDLRQFLGTENRAGGGERSLNSGAGRQNRGEMPDHRRRKSSSSSCEPLQAMAGLDK